MTNREFLSTLRPRDTSPPGAQENWYTIAAVALAAAGAGPDVTILYQLATEDTSLSEEKHIQRRLKEAILKTSILYGVPRSLQALLPLFATLREEQIDHYGPRTEALANGETDADRQRRAREYFDTLWTPAAAQANRDKNFEYQPDLYLLNLEKIYELWISEDTILSPVETQMCNLAALVCGGSPVQAMWHARGVVRHGGTKEQIAFAQAIALAVAVEYGCRIGAVVPVEEIPFGDVAPH
ncbi:hypothetical protein BO86DRAFT_397120 [Aspergillus japonicus CBS 114.51]|uniref:Carboxymuconolactone decarboxylase-like domain-containing protein n=1 Tax=Aspergillus japonicus CBS 114.51 TaxID=1448312 RepID=A0A8T8X8P1_ASPJA|nr:hypothetical protein BO86DRAFT_397120 [Aspergillus japonicus CBS 114.51]RAH84254.1 hypothetical protein BO86DRAFT_397120 [Aspergillus japonicus CBS 114.51]